MDIENRDLVRDLLNELCEVITERIECALKSHDREMIALVFDANNDYQESCRDGVDYIFDLNKQEDLKCCVDGGLTWKEIIELKEYDIFGKNPFFFGHNHTTPVQIKTEDELIGELVTWVEDIVTEVIKTPYAYGSYAQIYTQYVTYYLECLTD